MKIRFLLFLFFYSFSLSIFSQELKGTIYDSDGNVIPYATIFIKELSMGTTSNGEGKYEVALQPGINTLQFRSMGYQQVDLSVEMDSSIIQKNIVLPQQVFTLHEIRVYKGDEDPAYPIMRRAIAMAPYYLNQVKEYKADVYLKGTAKLEKVPKFLRDEAMVDINGAILKEGDMYVGESFSEITFHAPDRYHQKIVSSNMTNLGQDSKTFDLGLVTSNPYQPIISDNMIMPIAPQAFANYKFRYEGYFTEGKELVNKIRIIPKRKSNQLFSGYLYVVDGLWCLKGIDLETNQFFGNIHFAVQFGEIAQRVWLPISHTIKVDAKIMGIKGGATYSSSVKYASFAINDELEMPSLLKEFFEDQKVEEELANEKQSKLIEKIDALMAKEELSKRDAIKLARMMKKAAKEAEPDSLSQNRKHEIVDNYKKEKEDSASFRSKEYWEKLRPNPLTIDEIKSYNRYDSLALVKIEKEDSIKKEPAKPVKKEILSKIIGKKEKRFKSDSISIGMSALINPTLLSFNAVEGWKYRQELYYRQKLKNNQKLDASVQGGYSFNRNEFQWKVSGKYFYAPLKRGVAQISFGNSVLDYADDNGISPLVNSLSSLLFKENYARYEQQKYFSISNEIELFNGVFFECGFDYANRTHLDNATNFSFFNHTKDYQPNSIYYINGDQIDLTDDIATTFSCSFEYTPYSFYRIKDGVKHVEQSKWPVLKLMYKKGISEILGSNANWDYLELRIKQQLKVGLFSEISYAARVGVFVNSKQVAFSDYAQINTSSVPVEIKSDPFSFKLLPYYSYNTNRQFFTAGIHYKTPSLLLKFLPWISARSWKENLHLNYLTLPDFHNYIELGYSLSDLLIGGSSIGVYSNFENGKYKQTGLQVVLAF